MEPKQREIRTLMDFLALTQEERVRFIPDLLTWAAAIDALNADEELKAYVPEEPYVIWIDDGKPAQIVGIKMEGRVLMFGDDE
jgi:hypothetical protein